MILKKKAIRRAARFLLVGGFVAGGVKLVLLIGPSVPERSAYLHFDGFITLPSEKAVNVMDYISVSAEDLFVASPSSGSVFKVTLDRTKSARALEIGVIPGKGSAHGIALEPSGQQGFISRSGRDTVDLVDPATLRISKEIAVAADPDAILFDPLSGLLYVASGESGRATLIDPAKGVVAASISLGGVPEFAVVDEENDLIYQTIKDRNMLAIVDPRRRDLVANRSLSECQAPTGLAIDQRHRRLFVNCSGNARLVVVDMDGNRTIAALPIAPHADSVAFDALHGRLYTTGRNGELSIIQQDGPHSYRLLDRIATHYGAHTLAVDPKTHQVYLAYASLLAAPKIAVFTPSLTIEGSAGSGARD